jgi:hypothetical protein
VTTETRPVRKRRTPKRVLRVLAWGAGVTSFLTPWGLLAFAPRPVSAAPPLPPLTPKVIIKHRVVKHIVWTNAPVTRSGGVHYVYVTTGGGYTGGGGGGSTGGSHP